MKARKLWLYRCLGLLISVTIVPWLTGCGSTLNKGYFTSFERSLSTTSYGYSIVNDPTGTAPTSTIERFEVRPGDCSSNAGWSDCTNDRERSELSEKSKNYENSEWWYGWSFYTPLEYPIIAPAKTAIGQFHQKDGPPAFMFQNGNGGYWIDKNFGNSTDYIQLLTHEQMLGKWNKIEVHALWKQENGFFRVFANGVLKYDFKGRTMSGSSVYFKYGVYRSYVSRYAAYNSNTPAPMQVILFANVKKAKSRQDLHFQ